jgi:hypothetical protein
MIKSIKSFVPPILRLGGRGWQAFTDFISNQYNYYFNSALSLKQLYDPAETKVPFEIGFAVGAYFSEIDDARTTRIKIAKAIETHNLLGYFDKLWKPLIDQIFGGDSSIYRGQLYYGSFIVGESMIGSPARIGVVDLEEGIAADKLAGQVFINIDAPYTTHQLDRTVLLLKPMACIYMDIYIGVAIIIDSKMFTIGLSTIGDIDLIGVDLDPKVIFSIQRKL